MPSGTCRHHRTARRAVHHSPHRPGSHCYCCPDPANDGPPWLIPCRDRRSFMTATNPMAMLNGLAFLHGLEEFNPASMRILLVADLHYSLPQFDWVLDNAARFDVVVIAGDHLDLSSIVDGRAQSVVVRKYFNRLRAKTRVLICSGNHDLDTKSESGEKVAKWLSPSQHEGILCDGESIVIDDTLFT